MGETEEVDNTSGSTTGISGRIITPEFDFDNPDSEHTFTKFAIKLYDRPSSDLTFQIDWSDDGGYTWVGLNNLVITSTEREGSCEFNLRASSPRVRIRESGTSSQYTIQEFTLRAFISGGSVEFNYK